MALVILGIGASPGCSGGAQSEGGNSGAEGGRLPCAETEVRLALDTVPDQLDFSANDVLALTQTREVPMRWDARDSGPVVKEGEDTLTLIVEPSSDEASVFSCDDPSYPEDWRSPPRLELPVQVTLETADGTLAERLDTALVAIEEASAAILPVEVEAELLMGTLGQAVAAFYEAGTRTLHFEMSFTEQGPAGWIGGPFSPSRTRPCAYTAYATWPADHECWGQTDAKPIDADMLQPYLERVNRTFELRWPDGGSTDARIDVELAEAPTCHEGPSVTQRVRIRVTTTDGRLDLELPGYLLAFPPAEGSEYQIEVSGAVAFGGDDLRDRLGYSDGAVSAAIVTMYVGEGFSMDPLGGEIRAVAIDRTGFADPIPLVELPGGDSERCFDAMGVRRKPFLSGELVAK